VSELTKRRLVADCTGVVIPSFAEGFRIPLIEGAALGRPVFCSDIPVFREIGGDDPFYFEPHDAGSIASAIRSYCQKPSLHEARNRAVEAPFFSGFASEPPVGGGGPAFPRHASNARIG